MSRSSSVTGEAITQAKRNFQEGAMPEDAAMDAQSQKLDPGHMNEDLFDHEVQSENALSDSSGLKRRRVTRACDECRRKKIKCDGKVRTSFQVRGDFSNLNYSNRARTVPSTRTTAHTINRPIGAGTPRHNTLRPWSRG